MLEFEASLNNHKKDLKVHGVPLIWMRYQYLICPLRMMFTEIWQIPLDSIHPNTDLFFSIALLDTIMLEIATFLYSSDPPYFMVLIN